MVASPPPSTTSSTSTSTSLSHWDLLPEEVLERILQLLPVASLLQALPVCHRWRRVAEWPRLWAGLKLRVKAGNLSYMPEVLRLPRLQQLRSLRVTAASEQLFEALREQRGLRELDARYCDLSIISADLLAEAVSRVDTVVMFTAHIRPAQAEAVFQAARQPESRLRRLHLGDNWLQGEQWQLRPAVSPSLLAVAACGLERLEMASTGLGEEQVRVLFMELARGQARLRYLDLKYNSLAGVEPEVVARAVNSLQTAILRGCSLTREQVTSILEQVEEGSGLQELDIAGNRETRDVAAEVLDRARSRIRRLKLSSEGLPLVGH